MRQLMMEMGFFVLLHANNLTRATSILKHSTAVLSSSGELVEVDSAVLCKSDNQDDEVHNYFIIVTLKVNTCSFSLLSL